MPKLSAYSKELDYSFALGAFPSIECVKARPNAIQRLLISTAAKDTPSIVELRDVCEALGTHIEYADNVLRKISGKDNCYAAIVFDKWRSPLTLDAPRVVLHNPSDMGNMGTIMRSMAAFGFRDLAIVEPAVDAFDPKVIRASMGSIFHLNIASFKDYAEYRHINRTDEYPFILGGKSTLRDVPKPTGGNYSLIFGNEGAGLPEWFGGIDTSVRIEQSDLVDSLNLGVAVSIALYEFSGRGGR